MLDHILAGAAMAVTVDNLLFMFAGTLFGLIFGAIPGLTFSTALVLAVPITFDLSSIAAISLLLGIYSGGMSAGAISSILLGIPGTPSAAATIFDGHPMFLKGEGGKALGMAVCASVFGGVVSLIVLILIAPSLARVALSFGPPELFGMLIFGLSTIVGLSSDNILKGLLVGAFGLFLTTVGLDPIMGMQRYVFNQVELMEGFDIMPVMIGMFALPEIIGTFQEIGARGEPKRNAADARTKAVFPSWSETKRLFPLVLTTSILGTGIGAIPGTGGPIAAFLAYNVAKKKCPACGTGVIEGVAAPESATNGTTGGALIPLLTLGIPGDTATAIMLGAFMVHGIAPGPLLFRDNASLVYGIFVSIVIIYVMILFIQFYGVRFFLWMLDFPRLNIMAVILVLSVVGAYAVKLTYLDIVIMSACGLLGYFMKKTGFSVTPLILAVVLGRSIESNFRKSLVYSDGSPFIFVTNPVCLAFLLLALFMLFGAGRISGLLSKRMKGSTIRKEKGGGA